MHPKLIEEFEVIKQAFKSAVLEQAGVKKIKDLSPQNLCDDDLHKALEKLSRARLCDVNKPSHVEAIACALVEILELDIDIHAESHLANVLGFLPYHIAYDMSEAAVEWVCQKYGVEAAEELASTFECGGVQMLCEAAIKRADEWCEKNRHLIDPENRAITEHGEVH